MDNWEVNIINWLTGVQKEIDNFYQQVDNDINRSLESVNQDFDQWIEDCEEYLEEMTIELNNLMGETDTFFAELVNLFLDEEVINEDYSPESSHDESDWEEWFEEDYKRKPNFRKHPACVGCRNYHGHSYGGNLLVCAIHPYGWEKENCPDWKKEA